MKGQWRGWEENGLGGRVGWEEEWVGRKRGLGGREGWEGEGVGREKELGGGRV